MGMTEELRWAAAKLVRLGKFAVDSAVNESLKGSAISKGESKSQSIEKSEADKKQGLLLVQEMKTKLEKMQHDTKNMHQQIKVSALGKQEEFDHHQKSSIPEVVSQRKVFIRSRL